MSKVYAFLADGFEEVEGLAVVDILRRAKVEVTTVSIKDDLEVTGSHGISIKADAKISDILWNDADLLFLPGGMPGTKHLGTCIKLTDKLTEFFKERRRLAAICAAPSVLGELGLLKGKKAVCYPGFEDKLEGAILVKDGVVTDGMVTTSRGMGFAIDLGLELVTLLVNKETSDTIRNSIQYE